MLNNSQADNGIDNEATFLPGKDNTGENQKSTRQTRNDEDEKSHPEVERFFASLYRNKRTPEAYEE
jgi:hypothetical protein